MKTVFADTGYWIALLDPQDTLHQKALNLSLSRAQAKICTSEMAIEYGRGTPIQQGAHFNVALTD